MNDMVFINRNDLRGLIAEVLQEGLASFSKWVESKIQDEDRILTRQQTADYLGISISKLGRDTEEGKIIAHGLGKRIYYKMSDIKSALIRIN